MTIDIENLGTETKEVKQENKKPVYIPIATIYIFFLKMFNI
jgi:hypothetical protein